MRSRPDLLAEFSELLARCEEPSEPARQEASRAALKAGALAVGLALGDIDSGGWAQQFFSRELGQEPPDWRGIIRKFAQLQAQAEAGMTASGLFGRWPALTAKLDSYGLRAWAGAPGVAAFESYAGPVIDESVATAFTYRQEGYKLADFQSDVSLLVYTKRIPGAIGRNIVGPGTVPPDKIPHRFDEVNPVLPSKPGPLPSEKDVLGSNLPPEEKERLLVEIRNSKLVIEGRLNPIKASEAAKMFAQVLAEEAAKGLPPRFGTPHRWTRAFALEYKNRIENLPYTRFSKLLTALASGVTHRFLVTDQELLLLTYVLGRPDDSVTFDELFRKSYQLNRGDVYLALLTMENILAEFWRTPDRENRAVTRKLAPITNNFQGRGDKFGAWYHLCGLMLYAYATDERTAAAVARTETLGSRIMARGEDETQEDWINAMGPVLGGRLQDIVLKQSWKGLKPGGPNYADPKQYLDLSEDFRDRVHVALGKDISAKLSADGTLLVASLGKARQGCLLELIPDQGSGLDSRLLVSKPKVDLLDGRPAAVHRFVGQVAQVRGFLSRCQAGPDAVFAAVHPSQGNGAGR